MIFSPIEITTKDGGKAVLRSADTMDAKALIDCLKTTALETTFLLREIEECDISLEQEKSIIEGNRDSDNRLMLLAFVNDALVGIASIAPVSNFMRHRHRCSVAISICRKYTSLGIGSAMMKTLIDEAKNCGFEQIELTAVTTNEKAIGLYTHLGFEKCGVKPDTLKLKDGSYQSELIMTKKLR